MEEVIGGFVSKGVRKEGGEEVDGWIGSCEGKGGYLMEEEEMWLCGVEEGEGMG